MRLNKYINIILFISLASCQNEEEQPIPPTPTMSSFVPGSRLEWRKLMASDGSKIDALIPPRFWDKERKEPCDLAYASEIEKKQNIYRCLPVFEIRMNGAYVNVWADGTYEDPACQVNVLFYKFADYAKTYPGKYNGYYSPMGVSNGYCETDTAKVVQSFYRFDEASQKCIQTTEKIPAYLNAYTPFQCKKLSPSDFVMISY